MIIARTFIISGFVQGVGFRFFAQRSAARHQVLGYVRNLEDGRVETFVQGDEAVVKAFMEDMNAGPYYSRVEDIEEIVSEPNRSLTAFLIEK